MLRTYLLHNFEAKSSLDFWATKAWLRNAVHHRQQLAVALPQRPPTQLSLAETLHHGAGPRAQVVTRTVHAQLLQQLSPRDLVARGRCFVVRTLGDALGRATGRLGRGGHGFVRGPLAAPFEQQRHYVRRVPPGGDMEWGRAPSSDILVMRVPASSCARWRSMHCAACGRLHWWAR